MKYVYSLILILLSSQLSIAQSKYNKGLDFDDSGYEKVLKKARLTRSLDVVPVSTSLKMFAPIPKNQGQHGTCTAWASAYCAQTIAQSIKQKWANKELITANAYSPTFLFRLLKPDDKVCDGGSYIGSALDLMKEKGSILFKDLPEGCIPTVSTIQLQSASNSRITDYVRLFNINSQPDVRIQAVKKSLSEKKPVIIGMICPPSFMTAQDKWNPTEEALQSYGGHAMCVVGYDNEKFGGAFEVQNSWGTNWGNEGYTWISYADFAKFTPYAFELIDLPDPKPEVADLSGELKFVLASGNAMPANLLVSTRGLSVVPAKTAPGPLTLYRTVQPYNSGTQFRIYISNNEPAYVYALSTDLSNEITKIFPYEDGISAALTDRKNDVVIPDEDHFIEFDNKPGKDLLCVLYSKDELNINDLVQKISAQQGTFSERIFKVIGDKIVDPKGIEFSKDNIAFKGYSKGKSIIPMLVELEHR